MKKKYKLFFLVEVFLFLLCLFATNNFFKEVKCEGVKWKIADDENQIVDLENFQETFKSLQNKKITTINLQEIREKIKSSRIVDEVKIFKNQKNIFVELRPHKILGIAYYNFTSNDKAEDKQEKSLTPEFILDNGEKIFLKIKNEINLIPVIFDGEDTKIENLLPILKFINDNGVVRSMINTISLRENNFYLTTILNDSFFNLGSFSDPKSIIHRICNMYKIIYLSNDFPYIEFNEETLFLHKKKI
jgi:hypothetical protein